LGCGECDECGEWVSGRVGEVGGGAKAGKEGLSGADSIIDRLNNDTSRILVEFASNSVVIIIRGLGRNWEQNLALYWVSKYPPLLREPVLLTGKEMLLDVMRLWGQKRAGEKEDEAQLPGIVE